MADFLLDEFNGSGDLSTHAPDLNTWSVPLHPVDGPGNEETVGTNPTLAKFILDGSGAVQLDLTDASQDNVISLVPGTPPASADYAVEIELILPSYAAAPTNYFVYGGLGGRMWLDAFNSWNSMVVGFTLNRFSGGGGKWFLSPVILVNGNDVGGITWGDDVYDTSGAGFTGVDLGQSAQTVKIRAEFEGRVVRVFVNDVAQACGGPSGAGSGPTNIDWIADSSLDAAGTVGVSLMFQNDTDPSLSAVKLGRALGTYDFIAPPGAWWTDYVLTSETIA